MSDVQSIHPRLIVLDGQYPNEEYPILEGSNLIGWTGEKAVDIDIHHQEPPDEIWLSPEHARITFEDNRLYIVDLDSANGTSVNGNLINPGTPHPLPIDATIQMGTVLLQVRV